MFCGCPWYRDINRLSSGYRRCRRNAHRMPDARVAQARIQKHDQLLPGRPVADGLWCRTLHWVCSDSDSVLGRYGDPLICSMGAGLDAEAGFALFVASDLSRHRRISVPRNRLGRPGRDGVASRYHSRASRFAVTYLRSSCFARDGRTGSRLLQSCSARNRRICTAPLAAPEGIEAMGIMRSQGRVYVRMIPNLSAYRKLYTLTRKNSASLPAASRPIGRCPDNI